MTVEGKVVATNVVGNSTGTTLINRNPYLYRGCRYDRETGLYYLNSRYYDPETGRFLNADVFVSTGQGVLGNNMFAYCNNNPVANIDESGAFLSSILKVVIGVAVVAAAAIVTVATAGAAAGTVAAAVHCVAAGAMTEAATGEVSLKKVVETYENNAAELIHISVDHKVVTATPGHPFYVPQKGWTKAINLRAGDVLVLVNGEYVIVEWIQHEILEAPVKVFNFQVEDYHTYCVTCVGVLVHNSCGETSATKYGREQHKMWDYGPTVDKEVPIPGAGRADGVDFVNKIIYELKPNNPKAIKPGWEQLTRYANALEENGMGHSRKC
ncbi:MAG: hypothetical protein IJR95_01710 [Lachnospiraceae bacterium]|nr:hypothetical protein [Lachnospiraceae bacterium]